MRSIVVIVLAVVCLRAAPASAQDEYAAVLLQYLTGDADTALTRLADLSYSEVRAGIEAFDTTRSRLILTGAAAMHTEAALKREGGFSNERQLEIATAIVEFGERRGLKTNTPMTIRPRYATPVSDAFRRLWYCTVINGLETAALSSRADKYLAHALTLYPDNPEIRLLAGVAAEMRASDRLTNAGAAAQRRALEEADKHYRFVVAAEPDRLEARLRLGRVLQERGQLEGARAILTPLVGATDSRIRYLAALFLGGIEDREHHDAEALALYDGAAAGAPSAQTARLAASEIRHRMGDRQAAADAIPAATGAPNTFDPWWTYIFGEYWRIDLLLDAVRGKRRV